MTAPKTAKGIKADLDGLMACIIKRGIGDDTNFSVLKGEGSSWEVTFDGAEHVSIAMNDLDYSIIYRELKDKRSYNARLLDGGLFQMMYKFDGKDLVKHRLAYYPSPDLRPFRDDPDLYMKDAIYVDIVSRRIVPFPIRFDFDAGSHKDVIHPKSHVTFGDIKDCRVPVTSPLSPRWFVEFVLRNFYQTEQHDFISDLPTHRVKLAASITDNERKLIHLSIPS